MILLFKNWLLQRIIGKVIIKLWQFSLIDNGFFPPKDPYALDEYLQCATFLPDLDNARETKNSTYKQNILKLESFVMSYSTVDTTLVPKETGYFGFYAPNQSKVVIPLEESDLWKEDWIGLRTLSEQGKLFRFTTDCSHGGLFSNFLKVKCNP